MIASEQAEDVVESQARQVEAEGEDLARLAKPQKNQDAIPVAPQPAATQDKLDPTPIVGQISCDVVPVTRPNVESNVELSGE